MRRGARALPGFDVYPNAQVGYGAAKAYLVWGVQDDTHKIVGTEFQYRKMKKGNEELEAWLLRMLFPRINFSVF